MLKISLLTIFCPIAVALSAQGVQFETLNWQEALKKAHNEGKMIFLDGVTSWCGPCKMMAREVFPDSAVGAYFNRHFINLRYDMERGEGIDLSNRYAVWVYPSLLFVDSTGAVQHRSAGYHKPGELLELAQMALDSAHNLAAMERQYAAGNRHREFMQTFLKAKAAAFDPGADRIANEFLKTEDDYSIPENMDLIINHIEDPYSHGFQYLLRNRDTFETKFGKREVKARIESVFENYLQSHPELQLGEVQRLYMTLYPERGEIMASRYRLDYYLQKGFTEDFVRSALDHYARYPSEDSDELDEIASIFAEEVSDTQQLKTALGWSRHAIALHETYYERFTEARLLAKLGKRKEAKKSAKRALQMGQDEGEDTLPIEDFLESMK